MQLRADQKTLIDFDTVFYKIPPMHQHLKFLDSHSEPQTMPFHTMNIQHVTTPRRLFYCKNQNCVIEEEDDEVTARSLYFFTLLFYDVHQTREEYDCLFSQNLYFS